MCSECTERTAPIDHIGVFCVAGGACRVFVSDCDPLGYGGSVPGEAQVPAFLCWMHKREIKV